jgi:putative phosphoesterase
MEEVIMIKALVISDTHGKQDWLRQIIKDEKPFDVLICAGDLEDDINGVLGPVDYHIHVVKGNCDYGSDAPYEKIFRLGDRTVLLLHGHLCGGAHTNPGWDMNRMVYYAEEKGCDMMIYGHTHVPDIRTLDDGFIILNPGSMTLPRQVDRRRSYMVLMIEDNKVDAEIRYI